MDFIIFLAEGRRKNVRLPIYRQPVNKFLLYYVVVLQGYSILFR
jgi:hypothetical protein